MKKYFLTDISKLFNINDSAIRYYDDKGLFPKMERDNRNRRYATDDSIEFIRTVLCLKDTGMKLVDIKYYIDLVTQGDDTLEERYQMILEQEKMVIKKTQELKAQKDFIERKKNFYTDKLSKKK